MPKHTIGAYMYIINVQSVFQLGFRNNSASFHPHLSETIILTIMCYFIFLSIIYIYLSNTTTAGNI